jgi:RNA polymerase sigma factor (sigma-70 family)
MKDEAIVELISGSSSREEGFRQLVLKYQQRLYDVIRRRVGSHEDADDLLQNTFLKVFRHIQTFEGRSELFTWMYRIACNEVIDHQKKVKRMQMVELDQNAAGEADHFLDATNISESLENAVSKLPERQQMVFRMRYFDELTYKQISEILQLTEGALKASFHHAIKKIEEEFRAKQIW